MLTDDEQRIRSALRSYAEALAEEVSPPPAGLVWLRARARKRSAAVQRAMRPLRVAQASAVLLATMVWTVALLAPRQTPHGAVLYAIPLATYGKVVGLCGLVAGCALYAMFRLYRWDERGRKRDLA